MMLLDQYGRPVQANNHQHDELRGGWIEGSLGQAITPALAHLSRANEQRNARLALFSNPLVYGALEMVQGFVVGDQFSYGAMDDQAAQTALEEFWAANQLDQLAERAELEFSTDGENCVVFLDDPGALGPATVGLLDVARIEVTAEAANVLEIRAPDASDQQQCWSRERLVWRAHLALYNDPRGWPMIMHAVGPALAYVNLINHRLRIHELQSRLNAIYYAFVNPNTPDGGLEQLRKKASMYNRVPRSGAVLTLAKNPDNGQREELEFTRAATGAIDAESDARLIMRLFGLALGLFEHWLGEAGNANRATASEMGEPMRKGFKRRQMRLRRMLDQLMRKELIRRFGPNRRYGVSKVRVSDDGRTRVIERKRVSATALEFPWQFPSVEATDMENAIARIRVAAEHSLASRQTLMGELGFDPALELERLAMQGAPNE